MKRPFLQRYCGNCEHFDGDAHCALPYAEQVFHGPVIDPESVSCEKHEPKVCEGCGHPYGTETPCPQCEDAA